MNGKLRGRLILDSDIADMQQRVRSQLGNGMAGTAQNAGRKPASSSAAPAQEVAKRKATEDATGKGAAKVVGKRAATQVVAKAAPGVARKTSAKRKAAEPGAAKAAPRKRAVAG
jgi:hypothetical protein